MKRIGREKKIAVHLKIWKAVMPLWIWICHCIRAMQTSACSGPGVCCGLCFLPLRRGRGVGVGGHQMQVTPACTWDVFFRRRVRLGPKQSQVNAGQNTLPFLVRAWKQTPCRHGWERAEEQWCHRTSEEFCPAVMSERLLVSYAHVWCAHTSSLWCQWSPKTPNLD